MFSPSALNGKYYNFAFKQRSTESTRNRFLNQQKKKKIKAKIAAKSKKINRRKNK
jgi:hypothetical protein